MGRIYDIITVGSATVDVFVKTDAELIEVKHKHTNEEFLAYPAGKKILVQELHQEVGGSAVNAAASFSRMGFKTAYFGALSTDSNSAIILDQLHKFRIDFIGVRKNLPSNYSVILDSQHDDRTILAYKAVSDSLRPKDVGSLDARWFYLTTLNGTAFPSLVKVAKAAKLNSCMVAFNPSYYLAEKGLKTLSSILKNTDVLIFNKEEARALLKLDADVPSLLLKLKSVVGLPVITDGKNGAFAYSNGKVYHALPNKNLRVVETTGAGDAFAAGFISGLMLMKPVSDCLRLGMLNSESVIAHIGAQNVLLDFKHAMRLLSKDKRSVVEL